MDLTRQATRAAEIHEQNLEAGKTCIDCHKGIAHRLPDMAGVPQG
jgi:cytochrome c-type protein NapC